jgi:hypothetical protein
MARESTGLINNSRRLMDHRDGRFAVTPGWTVRGDMAGRGGAIAVERPAHGGGSPE